MKKVDLRKLSSVSSAERAFLTIYISEKSTREDVEKALNKKKKVLKKGTDDFEYFSENFRIIMDDIDKNPVKKGTHVIFCCWALDYYERIDLEMPVEDLIRIDSSPYILPLAQFEDEYENYLVIAASNEKTKIYMVSCQKTIKEDDIKGNIKNHVKVGGWSQQRYERRRDKEFSVYVKDIVEKIRDLAKGIDFRRIVIVGSKETIRELGDVLPNDLKKLVVGEKALDLKKSEKSVNEEIFSLLWEEERRTERELWNRTKSRYLKGELGVTGTYDVLYFTKRGRVDSVIVNKNADLKGVRCRNCEELSDSETDKCPECGSSSIFEIDLVNEITELLKLSGGEIEFAENIDELKEAGDIAAILRY